MSDPEVVERLARLETQLTHVSDQLRLVLALTGRIDALERESARAKAWLAGVLAAVSAAWALFR